MTDSIARRYYYGTTAIHKPGDELELDGQVAITTDPAEALADAWRAAETGGAGVPHVYELIRSDGEALIVTGDVPVSGALAWRATQIVEDA